MGFFQILGTGPLLRPGAGRSFGLEETVPGSAVGQGPQGPPHGDGRQPVEVKIKYPASQGVGMLRLKPDAGIRKH